MGLLESVLGTTLLAAIGAVGIRAIAPRPMPLPTDPPAPEVLATAKRRFIAEMNHRIFNEPQVALQLQTLRDMVVGWYELKGPVIGVRFVARACCEACYQLDGQQVSLLDVRHLVRYVPPVHRERGPKGDCSCTLMPITAGRGGREQAKGAVRSSRPLLR